MISNCAIPAQALPEPLKASRGSLARPHAGPALTPRSEAETIPGIAGAIPTASPLSQAQDGSIHPNNLTAVQSPIGDPDQAAAATQHARLLLQAQPRLALAAQANSSSQSVARLLQ